jgi:hypothetical protein
MSATSTGVKSGRLRGASPSHEADTGGLDLKQLRVRVRPVPPPFVSGWREVADGTVASPRVVLMRDCSSEAWDLGLPPTPDETSSRPVLRWPRIPGHSTNESRARPTLVHPDGSALGRLAP